MLEHLVCQEWEWQPLGLRKVGIGIRRVAANAEHLGASILEHCTSHDTVGG